MPAMSRSSGGALLLSLLALVGCCEDWTGADGFRSKLSCGLSTKDARTLALSYSIQMHCSTASQDLLYCFVEEGCDGFRLEFRSADVSLCRVTRYRRYGLTGIKDLSSEDLCASGESDVQIEDP